MNTFHSARHTGRENIEYVEDRRDYSKFIMFVVIPIVLFAVAHLVGIL